MKKMISTVVFDIGNVLIKFDYRSYIRELFNDDEVGQHAMNAIWESGLWAELDRGGNVDDILEQAIALDPEYENAIRYALDNAGGCLHRYDYAIPWVEEVKKSGYRVLYLSNYSTYARQANPEVLDFLPYMDGGLFSYEVKLIKPDQRIYRVFCERFSLSPEECIFIDDSQDNVLAAKEIGFHTIRFENYKQARNQLEVAIGMGEPGI